MAIMLLGNALLFRFMRAILIAIKDKLILLAAIFTLNNNCAIGHNLDPGFENPFQLSRDVDSLINDCKYQEAVSLQQKYLKFGSESCRQMALTFQSSYLPTSLPVPPNAEDLLRQAKQSLSLTEKIRLAKECVKRYPSFEYGYVELSKSYLLNRMDRAAERESLKAVSIAPSNVVALSVLGSVYVYIGNEKKARLFYERLLKVDPKDIDALAFFDEMNRKDGKLSNLVVLDRNKVKQCYLP
ncbi:MAG: hypothetical protein WC028_00060 [Candidatus Obscuribacterales bacterium]